MWIWETPVKFALIELSFNSNQTIVTDGELWQVTVSFWVVLLGSAGECSASVWGDSPYHPRLNRAQPHTESEWRESAQVGHVTYTNIYLIVYIIVCLLWLKWACLNVVFNETSNYFISHCFFILLIFKSIKATSTITFFSQHFSKTNCIILVSTMAG